MTPSNSMVIKVTISIVVPLFISVDGLRAQAQVDSLRETVSTSVERVKLDSMTQNLTQLPDTLLPSFQKIDSIRQEFNLAADSLNRTYQSVTSKIDAQSRRLKGIVDSLNQRSLPTEKYTTKIDSLSRLRQTTLTKFTSRLGELKSRTTEKLNALDLPPQYKEPLNKLTSNINGLNINSDVIKVPELKIPGYSLPQINGLADLSSATGQIGNINGLGKLPDVSLPNADLGKVTEQAQAYQQDIQNIAGGNLQDVEKLPEAIESQASRIDGMEKLQKQSGIIDEKKAMLDELNDPEKAKHKAAGMVKEAAVNHFAGKEEQLKSAMQKIAKYKQKYSSVSSLKDLPKRPPNPMKDKPFVERIVPGLYLQYQQKNYYLFDFNPYLGYRISGRFTSGLGWNLRYAYDKKYHQWNERTRIFGPRVYVDFKFGRGFIAHLESEVMNSFVPSTLTGNPDTGHREWVWSFMTGIKKEYKIYKNLKGTALIQYNLFNRYYKAPYVDRLNYRIGFEYVLKKKQTKKGKP